MKASVIITAWGESTDELAKAVRPVRPSAGGPVLETVLVINRYENDPGRTREIMEFAEKSREITRWAACSQNTGVARAWNIGANLCEGDFYVIQNGDCALAEGSVERLLEPFSNSLIGVVGVEGRRDGSKVSTPGLCEYVYGFCFAVRKETYYGIGGFDNRFAPLADEMEFCARAWDKGWGVFIADGVEYSHEFRISERPDEDIIYLGKKLDRRELDKKNAEYKQGLPWMGWIPPKK